MLTYQELPVKKIALSEIPAYFRLTNVRNAWKWNSYIYCGKVKRGGNEPYCYPEEKQCQFHVARVLCPDKTINNALVIRDDGTVWNIAFSPFEEVYKLEIYDDMEG